MTFLYVDASVWVSTASVAATAFMNCSPGKIRGPVLSTLARKCKAQEITREDFDLKIAEIERDWQSFVEIELTLDALDPITGVAVVSRFHGGVVPWPE